VRSGIKVELTVDLTKYHRSLVIGTQGVTCGYGPDDRSVYVHFPEHTLYVYYPGLKVLDEAYLSEMDAAQAEAETKLQRELDSAFNIIATFEPVGPNGRVRSVEYSTVEEDGRTMSHYTGPGLYDTFKEMGKPIAEKWQMMSDFSIKEFFRRHDPKRFWYDMKAFQTEATKLLQEIALRLGLRRPDYTLRKSEISRSVPKSVLHGENLYLEIRPSNRWGSTSFEWELLFRRCNSRKDSEGGPEHVFDFGDLSKDFAGVMDLIGTALDPARSS
jgi:hypothetical protein